MNDKENIKTNRPSPFENTQKPQSFDTQAINDVTQTSGVIPASTVTAPQPTLVVPEINMKESAPMANQAIQSAQAQVQEQTNLQTLTDQRIVDQQKQFAEQESLAQTIGGGGDVLRNEFNRGQEVLKPIEKDIQDLNSLINQKTRSIQNQLLDEEGRVVPKAFVTGRQAIIQQRGTAELSSLGALLDAKNGMLETAQGKLKLSMELFVAVNKAEVAEKEARVNLLKDITGVSQDEEQKEVDKLKAESDKFEEERDAISSIALQAMQSGAGADEIQRITQSKSEDEAIAAAKSLGRSAKLDMAIKNATLNSIRNKGNGTTQTPLQNEANIRKSEDGRNLIGNILGSKGGKSVVGSTMFGRGVFGGDYSYFQFTGKDDFRASVSQLLDTNFIKGIVDAKAQGANFGSLTEQEGAKLANSVSKISAAVEYDNDGKIKFIDMGEADFVEELERLQRGMELDAIRSGANITPDMLVAQDMVQEYTDSITSEINGSDAYSSAGYNL